MSRSRWPVTGLTFVAPQRLSVDRERYAADPYVAAEPVELLPGPGAVNVKVGAKT
jgi:hypothetical protein